MFRELARKKKQITTEECIQVLKNEKRGVLSVLGDADYPYGMPMNHWYNEEDGKIYFKNNTRELYEYDKHTVYLSRQHTYIYLQSLINQGKIEVVSSNLDQV